MEGEPQERVQRYISDAASPWGRLSAQSVDSEELAFIRDSLGRCSSVLDACGGTGICSASLAKHSSVTVLDQSEKMLAHGRKLYPDIQFLQGSVLSMPFGDASFDGVLIRASMMYFSLPDQMRYFSEACRVLKPGGRLCLIERNRRDFRFAFTPASIAIDPFEKQHDFLDFASAHGLLQKAGFKVEVSRGFLFCLPRLRGLLSPRKLSDSDRFEPLVFRGLAKFLPRWARWILIVARK